LAPLLASAPEAGPSALPPGPSDSAPRPGVSALLPEVAALQTAPGSSTPAQQLATTSRYTILPEVALRQTAPVGSTPGQQLAAALRDTIVSSGLFYESHLSDWVHGQRSLADLRREPQAAWSATRMATVSATNPGSSPPDSAARGMATARDAPTDTARTDPSRTLAAGVPEEARPILRQQLETLESRQIAWQGPVWPGQQATLVIAEDSPSRSEGQATPVWRTTLDLSLPQLGAVHADLMATGEMLTICVAAPDTETARILRSGLPALDELLRSAGLRAQSLTVTHDA
jgi:hypothetical protein